MGGGWVRLAGAIAAWLVASAWALGVVPLIFKLRTVPELNALRANCMPAGVPSLTVVVPAKDEGAAIEATLRSLLLQDYPLDVVAVNDRSTDSTGAKMDAVAAEFPGRVRVLHVTDLPAGWAGKVHAMTRAAEHVSSEYLLFTDGDVAFAPDALRRALTAMVAAEADHFVLLPTLRVESWDEGVVLATIQTLGNLAVRLWKVPDPRAKRDALGVGAFTLVRRLAFEEMGGFARRPLEMTEDLRLGQDMKVAGYRAGVAFGRDLVCLHWATGAIGIVRGLTKNAFAALAFRVPLAVGAVVFPVLAFWVPLVGLFVPGMRLASIITWVLVAVAFRVNAKKSGVAAGYGLLSPLGALAVAAAVFVSTFETLRQGGVWWRGTFYSLAELRARR